MSNSSAPSTYAVRIWGYNFKTYLRYRLEITLRQQEDGGMKGDAGDGFDGSRNVTLTLPAHRFTAQNNRLGGSDTKDYSGSYYLSYELFAGPVKFQLFFPLLQRR